MYKLYIVLFVMVITFLSGIGMGYMYFHSDVKEPPAKEIILHDSSIIIQRVTDTIIKDKLVLVDGMQVIHKDVIKIVPDTTVHIDTVMRGDTVVITKTVGSDTVSVILAILKDAQGGIRVQAKTIGGRIVGAIDVPMERYALPAQYSHTIYAQGMFVPSVGVVVGLGYDRTYGRFVIGGLLTDQVSDMRNIGLGIKTGVSF